MNKVFIYYLSTKEEPNNIRYVGKATNLQKRLERHLQPYYLNEGTYKSNWLKSVLKKGHTPTINLIEEVLESNWEFWEQYWILQFKNWGFNLTNGTYGGEGIELTDELIKRRTKTNFDKNTKRLINEIEKFNIKEKDGVWIGERSCPKCNQILKYKSNNRSACLKNVRRGYNKNQTCLSCRDCINNLKSFIEKPNFKETLRNSAAKKKVIMLSLSGEPIREFISIRDAENQTKINRRHISGCCNNKPHHLSAGGYKWKFN